MTTLPGLGTRFLHSRAEPWVVDCANSRLDGEYSQPVGLGYLLLSSGKSREGIFRKMAYISDRDKDVFSNAEKTGANNFTEAELSEIHTMALRLREILDASIGRGQASFEP